MAKVSLAADEALLAHYPKAWPARVVVDAADGRHEKTVTSVPGDPQRPFDRHKLEAKLRRVLPQAASGLADGLVDRCRAALGIDSDGSAALVRDIAQATAAGPRDGGT